MHAGFADGLNLILLIGAITAFVAAFASLVLIRNRDFVTPPTGAVGEHSEDAVTEPVAS